jgi:glyoxylase-like metal-dependent hydrolase (beta-lactamase superfamily II)
MTTHSGNPVVIPIPLGLTLGPRLLVPFVNAYLVRSGDRWALVDAGPPGSAARILAMMARHGVEPEQVSLILITHGHFDHYGGALELVRRLPNARIAMHPLDRPFVSGAGHPWKLRPTSPAAAASLLVGMAYFLLLRLLRRLRSWSPEVLREVLWLDFVSAEPCDLKHACGFNATAVLTPGHSPGSVSVRLRTGEALTGDVIAVGRRGEPARPMLVDDQEEVPASLDRIARLRPSVVYPGHGRPFSGNSLERLIQAMPLAGARRQRFSVGATRRGTGGTRAGLGSGLRRRQLEPDDAGGDQRDAEQPGRIAGLAEERHAQDGRADGPDAGPDSVGGPHRQVPQR